MLCSIGVLFCLGDVVSHRVLFGRDCARDSHTFCWAWAFVGVGALRRTGSIVSRRRVALPSVRPAALRGKSKRPWIKDPKRGFVCPPLFIQRDHIVEIGSRGGQEQPLTFIIRCHCHRTPNGEYDRATLMALTAQTARTGRFTRLSFGIYNARYHTEKPICLGRYISRGFNL